MVVKTKPNANIIISLGVASGLLYSLWLLGYYLNRPALDSLDVSALQAKGEPHYVFFVVGDVITGLMTIMMCYLITRLFKKSTGLSRSYLRLCVGGLLVFGLMTAISCLLSSCIASSRVCLTNANNVLDPHDLTSSVGAIGLFFSMIGLLKAVYKQLPSPVFNMLVGLLLLWSVTGLGFVLSALSLSNLMLITQHLWLILCSLCLITIPTIIVRKDVVL